MKTEQTKLLESKPTIVTVVDPLLGAIQFAYENNIWPSSRNIATLLGLKYPKLDGPKNARRRKLLREHFNF